MRNRLLKAASIASCILILLLVTSASAVARPPLGRDEFSIRLAQQDDSGSLSVIQDTDRQHGIPLDGEHNNSVSAPAEETAPAPSPAYNILNASSYVTAYQQGLAENGSVLQNVGTPTFYMDHCSPKRGNTRVVSVRLERPQFESGPMIDAILFDALVYAYQDCPVQFTSHGVQTGIFAFDLRQVNIYMPDGTLAVVAYRLRGDGAAGPGDRYSWTSVRDLYGEKRAAAALQSTSVTAAEGTAANQTSRGQLWFFAILSGALFWALVVYFNRNTLARWYYSLTPHPAAAMVDEAIRTGEPLDGKRFLELTSDMPDGTIAMEVLTAQALALAERWHRHEATIIGKHSHILSAFRERLARENDLRKAQTELRKAAVAHQQASADLEALRQSRN